MGTRSYGIAAVDKRLGDIVAVARWMDLQATGSVEAYLVLLDDWKGFGVGSFYDVMLQTAVQEGKHSLTHRVPADMANVEKICRSIAKRHAIEVVTSRESDDVMRVEVKLKSAVDRPTILTRFPGVSSAVESSAGGNGCMSPTLERHVSCKRGSMLAVLEAAPVPQAAPGTCDVDGGLDDADLWGY